MTSSLAAMLAVFDVTPAGEGRFVGTNDYGERAIVDGSQVLAQAIVAASKTIDTKVVRQASAIFCRPVKGEDPIDFTVEVVQNGRTFATAIVTAAQSGRTRATVQLMMDVPTGDVVRHPPAPTGSSPDAARPHSMPLVGRELRLVGIADPNDPDEVGPPRIEAWLRYDETPERDDLRRALLAHFTGHLSISTSMRPHPGVGTAMAHRTLSTGVMAIQISFHDPIEWNGWLNYDHESTAVGAGMSYVRGQIRDEAGRLLASFAQDGLIRHFDESSGAQGIEERSRL